MSGQTIAPCVPRRGMLHSHEEPRARWRPLRGRDRRAAPRHQRRGWPWLLPASHARPPLAIDIRIAPDISGRPRSERRFISGGDRPPAILQSLGRAWPGRTAIPRCQGTNGGQDTTRSAGPAASSRSCPRASLRRPAGPCPQLPSPPPGHRHPRSTRSDRSGK